MQSPCCLSVNIPLLFEFLNQFLQNLVCITCHLSHISTAYFVNPSHQSVCLYAYTLVVARQRLSRHVPTAMNTCKTGSVEDVVFYTVRVYERGVCWSVCLSPYRC
jgi:hypothetical protein